MTHARAMHKGRADTLRLLTYNLQVGIHTSAYHHYITRSWQHLLPHSKRLGRLDMLSEVLGRFDIVGLQEVDGGSFRSGNVNQVEYLAHRAGFAFHYQQLNRNLGRVAQHSNGLLARMSPSQIEEHRLPGTLPGRGAIHARFGEGPDALHVLVAHLALSHRGRTRQKKKCLAAIIRVPVVQLGDPSQRPAGTRHRSCEDQGNNENASICPEPNVRHQGLAFQS